MPPPIDWLNRLTKWRVLFAGWQLGTRDKSDPEAAAVRDTREILMIMRVELSTIVTLLEGKGFFTASEFNDEMNHQAMVLEAAYQQRFPGYRATDEGLAVDVQEAIKTNARYNFKP